MADSIVIDLDIDNGKATIALNEFESDVKKTAKKSSSFLNKELGSVSKTIGSLARNASLIGGAIAGIASALVFKESIQAAQQQENAVNQLNTSLRLAGTFSEQASKDFQDLASELQRTTTFGDETTLQFAALARNFTRTNEEAQELTKAAIDLSAATGLSLESSVKNLGKTFAGLTGELGESVPALRTLTAEQLKAGAAIDLIQQRFGGAAQAQTRTFSGAIQQASNSFGDLLESIGKVVTESPAIIKFINQSSKVFNDLAKQVDNFSSNDGLLRVVNALAAVGQGFIEFVVAPSELAVNATKFFATSAVTLFNRITAGLALVGEGYGRIINIISEGSGDALIKFSEDSKQALADSLQATEETREKLFDFSASDKLSTSLEELRSYFASVNEITAQQDEINNERAVKAQESLITTTGLFAELGAGFTAPLEDATGKVITTTEEANKRIKQFAKESGKALRDGFAQSAGNAFAEFGRAAASGENALEAFGKALFKSIAQQAVTLGTKFILEGTAYLFSPAFASLGPPLIAAGAGLAAFGGALGAIAGGGASTSSQGGAPTGAFAAESFEPEQETAAPDAIQERGPSNQIIVQGSIVDPQGILDAVSQVSEENGAVLTGVSFA